MIRKQNSSGKILTIFAMIAAVLLLSLTAVSFFFFQKELERRKLVEAELDKTQNAIIAFENEVKELKKSNYLLQEKNKEADDRINSLLDDLELNEALKDEIKGENTKLKEEIDKSKKTIEQLQKKFDDSDRLQQTVGDLTKKLEEQLTQNKELEQRNKNLEEKMNQLKRDVGLLTPSSLNDDGTPAEEVDLEKIVVTPDKIPSGRILNIDTETEFVIINLGGKDGVKIGDEFSVYRGKEYLGDIKVTRVQSEMSAADLIPPFSSRRARKNDTVIPKP